MEEVRENKDLLDSYSPNQFKSKLKLVGHINKLNILTKNSEIVIFGSWYGSILIPAFYDKVKNDRFNKNEKIEKNWRSDPSDGLRPLKKIRSKI